MILLKSEETKQTILISGKIKDKSKIKSFLINNEPVTLAEKNGEYEFLSNINVGGLDKIIIVARMIMIMKKP